MDPTVPNRRRGSPLTAAEAATALGVCERTLRRYIRSGQIRSHRLPGGHYRIPQEAIDEFWNQHSPRPTNHSRRRADAPTARVEPNSPRRCQLAAQPHEYDLSTAHLAALRAARGPAKQEAHDE
jgi:excisionase family DNA binding protein